MSLATLNSADVTELVLSTPGHGFWWAELALAGDAAFAEGDAAALDLGGRQLRGTIVAGGPADGRAAYRVIGGFGGWRQTIPRRPYANDLGIKGTTVTADAAQAVGETFDAGAASAPLGPHYTRPEGPAWRVLNGIWPGGWYVDDLGVTHPGARASSAYTGPGEVLEAVPAQRRIELKTSDVSGLEPGAIVNGGDPARDVEITLGGAAGESFAVTLHLGPAGLSRRLAALRRIIDALDPWRKFAACYEFRVVAQTGDRFDLQCVRSATGMPDLPRVPVRPGMAGVRATVMPGQRVIVAFVDGDPSRPAIIAHEEPDSPGWMPLQLELGGPGALGVARMTDQIVAGPYAGVIVGGSVRVKASM